MVEYTREILQAGCDIEWIGTIVKRAVPIITSDVLKQVVLCQEDSRKNKKILFDLITNEYTRTYANMIKKKINIDLTWKYATESIVRELKKVFIDSKIYYENKEISDIHDKITIHRLIRVDWSQLHDDV